MKHTKKWRRLCYRVLRWVRAAARLDLQAAELRELMNEVREVKEGMDSLAILHGRSVLTGSNIGVMIYTQGGVEHTRMFDFGARNVGAVLDLMERFEDAGLTIREAKSAPRPPRPWRPSKAALKSGAAKKPGRSR